MEIWKPGMGWNKRVQFSKRAAFFGAVEVCKVSVEGFFWGCPVTGTMGAPQPLPVSLTSLAGKHAIDQTASGFHVST